jgi:aldehyde:ferredoxin oxidoreductase
MKERQVARCNVHTPGRHTPCHNCPIACGKQIRTGLFAQRRRGRGCGQGTVRESYNLLRRSAGTRGDGGLRILDHSHINLRV